MWRLCKAIVWFGLLHYLVTLCLAGFLFLVSHIPPRSMNVDELVIIFQTGQSIMTGPRKLILWVCPGESTPVWLDPFSTMLNSLVWGCALAEARLLWRAMTK